MILPAPKEVTSRTVKSPTTVIRRVDVAVTKAASDPGPDSAFAEGETVTYAITVTNNGPNVATDVTVTDTLPAGPCVAGGGWVQLLWGEQILRAYKAWTGLDDIEAAIRGLGDIAKTELVNGRAVITMELDREYEDLVRTWNVHPRLAELLAERLDSRLHEPAQ